MSGGYFNHAYRGFIEFTEELQYEIDMNNCKNSDSPVFTFKRETMDKLKECKKFIEVSGHLAREIEFLYTGDITEEEFLANLEKIGKTYDS